MPKDKAAKNARVSVQLYINEPFHMEAKQLALTLETRGFSKAGMGRKGGHIKVNDLYLEAMELLKEKYGMEASPFYSDSSRIIKP